MDAKTIVAIVLVAFIIGACIWLNIRNRKKKQPDFAGTGRLATTSRPFPIYMEVYDEKSQNH